MMTIWTTYFAKLRVLPEHILPVSIALWPPKGWAGVRYPRLAPPQGLIKKYKRDQDEQSYIQGYNKLVLGGLSPTQVIEDFSNLLKIYPGKTEIAIVCYEKSGDFCHRHLVANWLKEHYEKSIIISEF